MMSLENVKDLISKWIVLEPLIFLFSLNNMNNVPLQNIFLQKFTKNFGNNNETDKSDTIQRQTNNFIRDHTKQGSCKEIISIRLLFCVMEVTELIIASL